MNPEFRVDPWQLDRMQKKKKRILENSFKVISRYLGLKPFFFLPPVPGAVRPGPKYFSLR